MSEQLALAPDTSQWLTSRRLHILIWMFVVLGIAARTLRYILCFPLWEDECFLNYNLIERGYAELLQPLDYHQVAPILFLWAQKSAVLLLGYSEYTLRLIPLLCGIASLLLFRHTASKLVQGIPLLIAVAVFAVAYPNIRYATEAKPYGCDLLVTLVLITLAVHWRQRPDQSRWLWGLGLLMPIAVGFSYPAVFTAGAVSLFVLYEVWRARSRRELVGWLAINIALVASFALHYGLVIRVQSAAEDSFMTECWQSTFPPTQPLALVSWLWWTHTSDLTSYPIGSGRGAGTVTFLLCVIAVVLLVRLRRFGWLVLLLSPLLLNLLAAALHRYPYGGHMRFALYSAAVFCLLSAVGTTVIVHGLERWRAQAGRAFIVVVLLFELVVGSGCIVRDIMFPYKTISDEHARNFARWFWFNSPYNGELVCLHRDLGLHFLAEPKSQLTWKAMYLCNQQIYSPRHARHAPPNWDRVHRDWPLRCVLYYAPQLKQFQQPQLESWLHEMQRDYQLVGREEFPMTRFAKPENTLLLVDYVYVFKFVPKQNPAHVQTAQHWHFSPPLR